MLRDVSQSEDVERTWVPDNTIELMNQLTLESPHWDFLFPYCLKWFLFPLDKISVYMQKTLLAISKTRVFNS